MRSSPFKTCLIIILLLHANSYAQTIGKQGFDLPIVDLDKEVQMQTIVDKKEGQYLGHPTTVLLEDGKIIICVYPKGHGNGGIVMKKSYNAGKTWSERLPTPKNWETSLEVPTLYPTIDANGKKRIIMFSGTKDHVKGAIRMARSEDDGETWSDLEPIGNYKGIVAMSDCIALKEKGHYIHLCEAGLVYSPDKSEIAMLLRENARNNNSQIMFSKDEGKTWTNPRPLLGALCGDRHQAIYLPDGRLLIQFRDRTPKNRPENIYSPTEGDWVGWVGSYEDLKNGYEGAYRVRFKDNKQGHDSTYLAAELLPDGSLVCTTYGHWEKGESPYILSFKFDINTIDKLVDGIEKNGQPIIENEMGG